MTRKGRKTKTIELPDELTLIVSDADILDSFSKNRLGSYKSNTLKGRYAISILRRDSAENVIRYLHKNGAREYSNTSIELSILLFILSSGGIYLQLRIQSGCV